MARRTQGGSTAQHSMATRKRRITPGRVVVALIVVGIIGLALFYGVGGWHFSNQIREDIFVVQEPAAPEYGLTVAAVDPASITLTGDEDDLTNPGLFGLRWPAGYAHVGDVLDTGTSDDGTPSATRAYPPFDEELADDGLAAGTAVDLDGFAFRGDPETVFGYRYEETTYTSEVGEMGAWLMPGTSDTWMILVHGRGQNREELLRWLPIAHDRGYNALVIDYRNDPGRGRDQSGWYQWGLTEWEDVADAASFARQSGARDLVFVGTSMGGGAVLNFLAKSPLRNQTIAAILDSPVSDLETVVDYNAAQTKLGIGPWNVPDSLTSVAKWLASVRFDIDWDDYDHIDLWTEWHVPMLVIHGEGDQTIPVETSRLLAAKRPDLVTLLVTPEDVDHVLSWNYDPEGYAAAVDEFLDGIEG